MKMSIADGFRATARRWFLLQRNCLPLVALGVITLASPAASQPNAKNVLVLSGGHGHESIDLMKATLRSTLRWQVNFSVVDLENPFEAESFRNGQAEALRPSTSHEKPDLVIAVMDRSLLFALRYRDKAFPSVPIVFMSVGTPSLADQKSLRGVTGVACASGISETIDLALRLHPDTNTIAIITDVSQWEKNYLAAEQSEILAHHDRVKEIDLIGPPSSELLDRVAALPAHTVILFQLIQPDARQPAFGAWDVLAAVSQRLPVYSVFKQLSLDHGGIGGAYYDWKRDAVMTGEIAARVLSGERPDDIPYAQNSPPQITVDWRQLRRWHIPESALPPGTLVLYREPTLWQRDRKYFLSAIAVILAQALLIFGLFWQRGRRRKAEIELGKSEEKFSKAFRQSPLAVTMVNAGDDRYVDVNETFELQTGWKRDEVIGRNPSEINLWVDPDQRIAFMKQLLAEGNVRDVEVRFRRKDGQIRTGLGSTELIEVNGERCALSVIADITERKTAEEALSGFSRRLIEAQEAERTRIARELHDDINQRLALVAVNLKNLKQDLPASEMKTSLRIEEACAKVAGLENDIQGLSHRLHSSKLEYLGLAVAASGFCRELSERQNVKIDFCCDGIPEGLSDDISLCLFRVLQEALHNAVKYSGVGEFEVSLTGTLNEVQLRVHDSGAGFDSKIATNGHGLGLTSMRERLRLVNGQLSIDSRPRNGTTILACVPLAEGTPGAGTAA